MTNMETYFENKTKIKVSHFGQFFNKYSFGVNREDILFLMFIRYIAFKGKYLLCED